MEPEAGIPCSALVSGTHLPEASFLTSRSVQWQEAGLSSCQLGLSPEPRSVERRQLPCRSCVARTGALGGVLFSAFMTPDPASRVSPFSSSAISARAPAAMGHLPCYLPAACRGPQLTHLRPLAVLFSALSFKHQPNATEEAGLSPCPTEILFPTYWLSSSDT